MSDTLATLLQHGAERDIARLEAIEGVARLDLDPALHLQSAWSGQDVRITPMAWAGGPIAFARCVRVDGGAGMQALNWVAVPRGDVPAPILGCEVLAFRRGVHLYVLDLYPTDAKHEPDAPRLMLRTQRRTIGERYALMPIPDWGAEVFSEDLAYVRPDGADAPIPDFLGPLHAGFSAWSGHLEPDTSTDAAARMERRAHYLAIHAADEPVGPFLHRLADAGWVERFTHSVLYPTWLHSSDDPPHALTERGAES